MRQIYYKGIPIYVWGEPVKGTGWMIFHGSNAGASVGMDDYGNEIAFTTRKLPYGMN